MKKIISVNQLILISLTLLTMGLVLPLGDNFIINTKQLIALVGSLSLLGLMGIKLVVRKRFSQLSALDQKFAPVLIIFGGSILASTVLTTKYPADNLLGLGGVYLSMVLIALLGKNFTTPEFAKKFLIFFNWGASVLGLTSLLQFLKIGPSWIYNSLLSVNLPHDLSFNLVESPTVAAQILLVALIGLLSSLQKKNSPLTWIWLGLISGGLIINIYSILPGQKLVPLIQPLTSSWSIALDTLRSPANILLGKGPNSYHLAYAQFKPAWINQTKLWNVQFNSGANLPLTLVVSTGVLGLMSWIWLVLQILKQVKYNPGLSSSPITWMLLALLATQLVLPPFTSLLTLFGLVLAAWLSPPAHQFEQKKYPHLAAQVLGVILLVSFAFGSYGLGRATLANYTFFKANQAGQNNQITQMYQLQQQAIKLNPYLASHHRRYALTNLSIATALANKTDLTSEEQSQILNLIQQSIKEGQFATQLQPNDVQNWQVLAQIYNNLIGSVDDADQWAVNSYVQAIQVSPTDPELRLALGSVFYNLEQFPQAQELFQQSLQLKTNLVETHYYLANTLVKQDRFEEAVIAYENTLSLLEPDTEAYQQATKELTLIQTKLDQQ